jgi:hypothetical protein
MTKVGIVALGERKRFEKEKRNFKFNVEESDVTFSYFIHSYIW